MTEKQPADQDAQRQSTLISKSPSVELRTIDSAELFQGAREIQIRHGDELYRLRITRNGKLILNK